MTKEQTIGTFENAMSQQFFLMTRIKNAILSGRAEDFLDIVGKEELFCEFFYDEKFKLEDLVGIIFFDSISKKYEEWKKTCEKIYSIFLENPISPKSKLKHLEENDYEIAEALFESLENIHDLMHASCESAQSRLHALNKDHFKA